MFHHVLHHLSTMYAPFLTHLQVRLGWLDIGRPSRTGGPQPGCCWLFQMSHYHQVRVRDRKSSYNCLIIIHNICMLMYIIYIHTCEWFDAKATNLYWFSRLPVPAGGPHFLGVTVWWSVGLCIPTDHLVNSHITMENHHFCMGKSTINGNSSGYLTVCHGKSTHF